MGFFDRLKHKDINRGVKEYELALGAVLLDVRTPEEYREGHIPKSKMCHCRQLIEFHLLLRETNTVICLLLFWVQKRSGSGCVETYGIYKCK